MANYLSVTHLSKTYGFHTILSGVSFVLNGGERIGLVGANGVGKSTLLKIITGEVEADGGSVMLTAGMHLGYLAQTINGYDGKTLDDLISESMSHVVALEDQMRDLEIQMSTLSGEALDSIMSEYG